MAGEIWLMRNRVSPEENVEEYASIRGVQRVYRQQSGIMKEDVPSPKEIYEIAIGKITGNRIAAIEAFKQVGQVVGDAISNAITLLDGIVVIGGGLSGASSILLPFIIEEMNNPFVKEDGTTIERLMAEIYNLDDENEITRFVKNSSKEIVVFGTNKKVKYDLSKRIGVGITKIGTSKAIAIGAYTFALTKLDKKK